MDVNLTDGQQHGLELYFVDWVSTSRAEQVQISNAATGAVLNTQTISSFHSGLYLDYAVSGNILITFTRQGWGNAVLSGLFLDPASIVAGTELPLTRLGATATTAGTVVGSGNDRPISAITTPSEANDFATPYATANVDVLPASSPGGMPKAETGRPLVTRGRPHPHGHHRLQHGPAAVLGVSPLGAKTRVVGIGGASGGRRLHPDT